MVTSHALRIVLCLVWMGRDDLHGARAFGFVSFLWVEELAHCQYTSV